MRSQALAVVLLFACARHGDRQRPLSRARPGAAPGELQIARQRRASVPEANGPTHVGLNLRIKTLGMPAIEKED